MSLICRFSKTTSRTQQLLEIIDPSADPNMESEETSENFLSKELEGNIVNDVHDHASASALGGAAGLLTALGNPGLEGVPAKEHSLETGENSVGNGELLPNHHCPPTAGVGEELLVDLPVKEGEGDSDLEEGEGGDGESDDDDDDEVEYDDEDMFFDQHFEPIPPALHRNDSMKEPMGEEGGTGERRKIIIIICMLGCRNIYVLLEAC